MKEQDFIRLLDRFEQGLCSPEEQRQLEQWLDTMKEGPTPFTSTRERDELKIALRAAIYRKAGLISKDEIFRQPIQKNENQVLGISKVMYRIAASIIILIAFGYGLWTVDFLNLRDPSTAETISDVGIKKVLLADGSIVWLKPNSKLVYPTEFQGNERVVSLEGEGLFEVAKDSLHPFIIHSGGLTTEVLGTSFNIKNTLKGTEIYVLTGKVSVTSTQTRQNIELLPNEKIVYADATLQKLQGEVTAESTSAYTTGTEYIMSFRDTRISEIVNQIERKFSVEVEIEGDIKNCIMTADFTDQSINNTLDMISEALNAQYELSESKVVLKGAGCN